MRRAASDDALPGCRWTETSTKSKELPAVRNPNAYGTLVIRVIGAIGCRADAHSVININIPRTESDDTPMPEIRVVEMNAAAGTDAYERRVSPFGQVYYWVSGDGMEFTHTAPESDVEALLERCITVTPLTYVLTDHARLQTWKERLGRSHEP